MHSIPIRFQSLVIEFTSRCNAKCDICYQAAGAKGSDIIGDKKLNKSVVEKVINAAKEIEGLGPVIHISGGEGFLWQDELISYMNTAKQTGYYTEISTVTNAFWGKRQSNAEAVLDKCVNAGLTKMEISWDVWHMPYIEPIAVENVLHECSRKHVTSILRVLTTKKHSVSEALSLLDSKAVDNVTEVVSGPVAYTGRAKEVLHGNDIYPGSKDFACHPVLNLAINANGDVYPCCAGSDQTDGLCFGNINDESIVSIARRMQNSPMLRSLVFGGIQNFSDLLVEKGISPPQNTKSGCQLCVEIFSDNEMTRAIKEYFESETKKALLRAADTLGVSTNDGRPL